MSRRNHKGAGKPALNHPKLPKTVAEMPLCMCGCGKPVGFDPAGNLHIEHFKLPRRKRAVS